MFRRNDVRKDPVALRSPATFASPDGSRLSFDLAERMARLNALSGRARLAMWHSRKHAYGNNTERKLPHA